MTELNFKGKEFVYNHHLAVPFRPLIPHADKGIGPVALDGNLIIHGDNLHALKSLLPLYAGKVDCIFIDPPYNTGNEGWCYNDNVNSPMIKEWLSDNPIGIEDGLRHDKWCAMMWPRLRLLHELLRETGFLCCSIDDNELHRVLAILDEIFGSENRIVTAPVITNLKGNQDQFGFAGTHEYLVIYAKEKSSCVIGRFSIDDENVESWLEDEVGFYKRGANLKATGQNAPREKRPNLFFPIYLTEDNRIEVEKPNESSAEVWPITDDQEMSWRWSKDKFKASQSDIIIVRSEESISLYKKQRPAVGELPSTKPKSFFYRPEYSSTSASNEIKQMLGAGAFSHVKALDFVMDVIQITCPKDGVILDSFAGSGTTAHASLLLNRLDGGRRKFILIECEDYAKDVTAHRVKNAIFGTSGAKSIRLGSALGGTFTYCTLGDPVELDKVLSGKTLPSYAGLGAVLFHMATNRAMDPAVMRENDFYLGATESQHVWLIYKPDLDWLKSPDAALTLSRARAIAGTDPGKRHLVIAAARFVSQKMLAEQNLPVEFVPLPFALYRIDRS